MADQIVFFKPPDSFIQVRWIINSGCPCLINNQKSLARQAKLKQRQQEREANPDRSPSNQHINESKPNSALDTDFRQVATIKHDMNSYQPIQQISKHNAIPNNSLRTFTNANLSKTVLQVQKLGLQREERRQKQQELKRQKNEIDECDQQTIYYKHIIEAFRFEFASKRSALKGQLHSKFLRNGQRNIKIKVCIRKRPISTKGKI